MTSTFDCFIGVLIAKNNPPEPQNRSKTYSLLYTSSNDCPASSILCSQPFHIRLDFLLSVPFYSVMRLA